MFTSKFLLAFGFIAVCAANPMGGAPPNGMPMGGPFGDLAKSLTEDQKNALKAIYTDETKTKQQIFDGIKAYFDGIGGDAATKFADLNSKMESMKTEFVAKAEDASKDYSQASKDLIAKIKGIKLNMALTVPEEKQQVKAAFDGASEEVKTELKALRGQLFGGFEGHFTTPSPK